MKDNWISVKDRLPKYGTSIMIYSKEGGVAEGEYKGNNRFDQYRWSAKDVKATHWKERPEPPKE